MRRIAIFASAFGILICAIASADEVEPDPFSLPLILMQSTFKLEGNGGIGTGFVLAHVLSDDSGNAKFILVTADHVLRKFKGEYATIHFRKADGAGFTRMPKRFKIRDGKTPLWKANADRDIAVLLLSVPSEAYLREISAASTALLANDAMLAKFELSPGDELMVLGFPHGVEGNSAGFPILRSGRVASYPLLPTRNTKSFLLDFEVFQGNSGGPVFLYDKNRRYGGTMHLGQTRFIVGLVSKEKQLTERIKTVDTEEVRHHSLALAQVAHASDIRILVEELLAGHPIPETE